MIIINVWDMMTSLLTLLIIPYKLVSLLMLVLFIFILLKSRITPLLAIITESFRLGIIILQVIDLNKNMSIEDWVGLCFGLLWGCIWITYFIRSKRVLNTFLI